MAKNKKVVLILDAKNFVFRAVTALNELLLDFEGREVTGGFNSIRMINRLIDEFKPDSIVAVWDISRPEIKTRLLPTYKENRSNELGQTDPFQLEVRHRVELAMKQVRSVLDNYGCIHIDIADAEADDVIGAMIYDKSYFEGWQKIVVSTDKDYLHFAFDADVYLIRKVPFLVCEKNFSHVFSKVYSIEACSSFSLYAFHLYHALSGDKSDNIPGIPGLGTKSVARIAHALDVYYKDSKEKLLDFDSVCFAIDDLHRALKIKSTKRDNIKNEDLKYHTNLNNYLTKLLVFRNVFEFNWSFVDPKFWVTNGIAEKLNNFQPSELSPISFEKFSEVATRFKISSPAIYFKKAKEQNMRGRDNFCEFRRKRV